MSIKFEILRHSGPSRLIRYIRDNDEKKIFGPTLIKLHELTPLHSQKTRNSNDISSYQDKNVLTLAYLPPLHSFSKLQSGNEFISTLQSHYISYINENKIDFLSFPIDRATEYRPVQQYPQFIQKVMEKLPDLSWAIPVSSSEELSNYNLLPLVWTLGEFSSFLDFPRKMSNHLLAIKKQSRSRLVYIPAVPPLYIPTLAYLGVDLFDSLYSEYLTQVNQYCTWSGEISNTKEFVDYHKPCACESCISSVGRELTSDELLKHNIAFLNSVLAAVRQAILAGTLRDLVKQTSQSYPGLAGLLRWADIEQSFLQQYTTVEQSLPLVITNATDNVRPEVVQYLHRLENNYYPSKECYGVILLPCSSKKPYSNSESHHKFAEAIKIGLGGSIRFGFEEWMVTSPLGIVPRFLEGVYPARYYDVTVTGHWSEEEYQLLKFALNNLMQKLSPECPIIAYLPSPDKELVERVSKETNRTINFVSFNESSTATSSIEKFIEMLQEFKKTLPKLQSVSKQKWLLHRFRAIANYQFGYGTGEILFPEDTEFKFKGFNEIAECNNKQIASLTRESGLLTLTLEGATQLIEKFTGNRVIFDGNELAGSALYCSGISDASPNIKPGDDVFVFNKEGKFLGIGKTNLTGFELKDLKYGLGVALRKKTKN